MSSKYPLFSLQNVDSHESRTAQHSVAVCNITSRQW